jgi:hypothetical protein
MAEPKIIVAENVGEELGKLIKAEADSFFSSSQDSDLVIGLSGIFRGYLSLTPRINCNKLKKVCSLCTQCSGLVFRGQK